MGWISLKKWAGGKDFEIQSCNITAIAVGRRTRTVIDEKTGNRSEVDIPDTEKVSPVEKINYYVDLDMIKNGYRLKFNSLKEAIDCKEHITGGEAI